MADLLYIGTGKYAAALDPVSGVEVWRAKLDKGSASNIVALLVRGEDLYVARGGYVWCFNRMTGQKIWENGLKGMGFSFVTLAVEGAESQLSELAAAVSVETTRKNSAVAGGAAGAATAG